MKIHHVQSTVEERWVYDDVHGPARKPVQVHSRSMVDRIKTGGDIKGVPLGTTFEVGEDGAFDVPAEVGEFFLRQPGWHSGLPPFPPEGMEVPPRRGPGRPRKPVEL